MTDEDKTTKRDLLERLKAMRQKAFSSNSSALAVRVDSKQERPEKKEHQHKVKKGFSNDAVDGIAAVVLILMFVLGMAYWLQTM